MKTETEQRYEIVTSRHWQRLPGCPGAGPERVSPFSLPTKPDCYEMVETGYTIRDNRTNTTSNYFYGQVIQSWEDAKRTIERLQEREWAGIIMRVGYYQIIADDNSGFEIIRSENNKGLPTGWVATVGKRTRGNPAVALELAKKYARKFMSEEEES